MKNTPLLKWLLLFFLAFIWGSSFILVKKGLLVFTPLQTACIRVSVAFFTLGAFSYLAARRIHLKRWPLIFLSGLIGILVPAFLFAFAQTELESSLAGVLNSLTPVFTLLLGVLLFQHKLAWPQLMGISIGFIGAATLILVDTDQNTLQFNPYGLLVVLASLLYGANTNLIKKYLSDIAPLELASLSLLLVGPLALIGLSFLSFPSAMQKEGSAWALSYLIILGVFSTGIAIAVFNRLIQMTDAVFASSVTYLIPIMAIVWGVMDGESLKAGHYLGIITIVLGVWLVNRQTPPKNLEKKLVEPNETS